MLVYLLLTLTLVFPLPYSHKCLSCSGPNTKDKFLQENDIYHISVALTNFEYQSWKGTGTKQSAQVVRAWNPNSAKARERGEIQACFFFSNPFLGYRTFYSTQL